MPYLRLLLLCLIITIFSRASFAQEPTAPQPQEVMTRAADGLRLRADFYLVDPQRPTILLLHQLYTARASWRYVIPPLVENGYNVLAVDLRGHGQTRGDIYWRKAVEDIAIWMMWLRTEGGVRPDGISTMGSSMGSTLAIVGCANDEFCRSAIAISPGWNYYDISLAESVAVKPILAVYAERDRWPALGIPDMLAAAPETFSTHAYAGNAHGMDMIHAEFETFIPLMLEWFASHN